MRVRIYKKEARPTKTGRNFIMLEANTLSSRNTITRSCPSCFHDNQSAPSLSYAPKEWPMKKCARCNMVYLEKAWSLDVLYEDFAWEESVDVENERREELRGLERNVSKVTRKRLRLFPRKNPATLISKYANEGNVLDVGSGAGHYLLQLDNAFVPYGIEISSQAVEKGLSAIEARGGNLVNKDALSGMKTLENNFFQAIIMRSFLEHDVNPKETLQEAKRILHSGAILIIKVPNYASLNRKIMGSKWCGLRFPEHVNYFTPKSLTKLVESVGLNIKRFSFFDKLPTSDNMWLIATK
jgi:SAM-dependent methyltransferase